MDELIAGLILAVVGGATLAALLTTVSFLAPGLAGRTARILGQMPGRAFGLGAVNTFFLSIVIIILTRIGDGIGGFFGGLFTLAGLVLFFVLLLMMTVGLTGLLVLLSERMAAGAAPTARRTLRAGFLLIAGGLAPIAGWFILTPLALTTGLGAAIIALIQWPRGSKRRPPALDETMETPQG